MSHKIPRKVKEEILSRIKQGHTVKELAEQYGISDKTIYRWLQQSSNTISYAKYNQLKRENARLKRLVGVLMLELDRKKK